MPAVLRSSLVLAAIAAMTLGILTGQVALTFVSAFVTALVALSILGLVSRSAILSWQVGRKSSLLGLLLALLDRRRQ